RHLHAAKRSIVEKSAILPGKRHALGDALVDDIETDLREPIDVGFTGAKVAAFDCVLEQTEDAVAVVAVVLSSVDPPLGGDGVRARWGVVIGKAMAVVAWLAERGSGGRPRQPRTHDDDRVFAAVRGIHQLHLEAAGVPLLFNWTGRYPCFQHMGLL